MALALVSSATAQQPPPGAAPPEHLNWNGDPKSPNLSGVWERVDAPARPGAPTDKEGWGPWPPPLKGQFAALWKQRVADAAAGKRSDDPVAQCMPPGMPRFMTGMKGALLIIQTPGRVSLTRELNPERRIWIDGRALPGPDELEAFFNGNSVGRYDGATLVVETVGVKNTPIDGAGIPHSDQMKVTERLRRVDDQTLQEDVTVTDPLALSRPISTSVRYKAITDPHWELRHLSCAPGKDFHAELFVQ